MVKSEKKEMVGIVEDLEMLGRYVAASEPLFSYDHHLWIFFFFPVMHGAIHWCIMGDQAPRF